MYEFSLFVLFLACYAFLGWIAEVLYVFTTSRPHRLQNRGFLTGPFLPIYGIGAIALLLVVYPYIGNPFLAFAASVVITSTLEFVTHLVLDKLFHIKLWDYSTRPFNLQGRICLQNSLLFGVLALLLIYVIHPGLSVLLGRLDPTVVISVASALLAILIIDFANSVRSLAKVRPVLDEVEGTLAQAHDRIEQRADARDAEIAARRAEAPRRGGVLHRATVKRLAVAYPDARSARAARTE